MSRAIVLAAGKGTRMKSTQPKVLHDICGRPMLWYVIEELRAADIDEIIVVANRELEPLLSAFGVEVVVQELQRGTGHAVQVALAKLEPRDSTVVIAYGDMPLVDRVIFEDVQAAVDGDAGTALGLVTAQVPLPSSFGRVIRSGSGIERIVEARDATSTELLIDEMNAGIYAYDETSLREVIGELSDDNAQGELYLTDTIALLRAKGKRISPVRAETAAVLGVNDRVELSLARATMNRRLANGYMRDGVTIIDPATTYLEPGLSIGADTIIYPNSTIGGATTIGPGARIGPNVRVFGATIGAHAQISESVVLDATIGEHTVIGPFAHVRGGAHVGRDAKIGNFVEVKASMLGDGVKAGHLSYLGDATIGERVNIGAGTITCNYDGVNKNRTTIGNDAFIGSNSSLVAPLTIGEGALTGAGSVVIRDVDAGERVVGNPAKPLAKKNPG